MAKQGRPSPLLDLQWETWSEVHEGSLVQYWFKEDTGETRSSPPPGWDPEMHLEWTGSSSTSSSGEELSSASTQRSRRRAVSFPRSQFTPKIRNFQLPPKSAGRILRSSSEDSFLTIIDDRSNRSISPDEVWKLDAQNIRRCGNGNPTPLPSPNPLPPISPATPGSLYALNSLLIQRHMAAVSPDGPRRRLPFENLGYSSEEGDPSSSPLPRQKELQSIRRHKHTLKQAVPWRSPNGESFAKPPTPLKSKTSDSQKFSVRVSSPKLAPLASEAIPVKTPTQPKATHEVDSAAPQLDSSSSESMISENSSGSVLTQAAQLSPERGSRPSVDGIVEKGSKTPTPTNAKEAVVATIPDVHHSAGHSADQADEVSLIDSSESLLNLAEPSSEANEPTEVFIQAPLVVNSTSGSSTSCSVDVPRNHDGGIGSAEQPKVPTQKPKNFLDFKPTPAHSDSAPSSDRVETSHSDPPHNSQISENVSKNPPTIPADAHDRLEPEVSRRLPPQNDVTLSPAPSESGSDISDTETSTQAPTSKPVPKSVQSSQTSDSSQGTPPSQEADPSQPTLAGARGIRRPPPLMVSLSPLDRSPLSSALATGSPPIPSNRPPLPRFHSASAAVPLSKSRSPFTRRLGLPVLGIPGGMRRPRSASVVRSPSYTPVVENYDHFAALAPPPPKVIRRRSSFRMSGNLFEDSDQEEEVSRMVAERAAEDARLAASSETRRGSRAYSAAPSDSEPWEELSLPSPTSAPGLSSSSLLVDSDDFSAPPGISHPKIPETLVSGPRIEKNRGSRRIRRILWFLVVLNLLWLLWTFMDPKLDRRVFAIT